MTFNNVGFLIFGVSKSGYSAGQVLTKLNAKVYFYDENNSDNAKILHNNLQELGAINLSNEISYAEILSKIEVVVLSPGVAINHPLCIEAKKLKKRIIGELELGFLLINSPIVAVTGTNGKTTTVSMLDKILEVAGIKKELVGNIGVPICSKVDNLKDFDTIAVTEVSSFQLETTYSFMPHIACILNITPDHLERHYNMENYIYLKGKILNNLRESEYAVLNFDDETVKLFAKKTRAKVISFSLNDNTCDAYIKDGKIYYKNDEIFSVEEIFLKGEHNLMNALSVVCMAKALNIDDSFIKTGLKEYKGAKHRMEFVKTVNGKDFYDDSKGTNTSSTISAIKLMDRPTVLILGGKEKGEDYTTLFSQLNKSLVKSVVLTGESVPNMLKCALLSGFTSLSVESDFQKAVFLAEFLCDKGGAVLLSPACASFDRFSSYAERGEFFVKAVDLIEENHS
ncbi:MAG: UDP-N-acetylmuramoyl-L-alanine--D-glutamate ligase [Clostridia bacterium]|nr:UDP-N-acetylmuramoyl-L-alanine--D-glutamate ligase [Clostridia bacterium]